MRDKVQKVREIERGTSVSKKEENCKLQEDCFAYQQKTDRCMALKSLYCKNENCSFYKKKSGKKG